jgi:hypothetical protein
MEEALKPYFCQGAQSLLHFSISWLVGGYDTVCERLDITPTPAPGRDRFPNYIHRKIIQEFYERTGCIECGRASFLESELCSQCPGKTLATVSPAITFRDEVIKDVYRRKYLPRIQAGEFQPDLADVEAAYTPPLLLPTHLAKQLVHKTAVLEENCRARQQEFDSLMHEFEDDIAGAKVEPVTEEDEDWDDQNWDDYGAFSLKVMRIASHVLACDQGIDTEVGEHVLRYLAPMLLHSHDPRRPGRWERYRVDKADLEFYKYQQVAQAYMQLTSDAACQALNDVMDELRERLNKIMDRNKVAMDALQMTKETLLTARVSLHSDLLAEPPTSDWNCPICYNYLTEEDIIKYHRCGHVAHRQCVVESLTFTSSQLCFYCRQPFGGPGEDPNDRTINRHQDPNVPWACYGL